MSVLLVYNSSFTNFLLDLAIDYSIFYYRNSIFKIQDCIFLDFDKFRSQNSRCFILVSETRDKAYLENLIIKNSTLNLMQGYYENRVTFKNLNISFHVDCIVLSSFLGSRNNFILFKNCTLHLLEKATFQIMQGSALIFKNNKVIQYIRNPSIFVWDNIINCTIVIKNSIFEIVNAFLFLTRYNIIKIKNCEFVFKADENFNEIVKAFFSNKIILENLRIFGFFAQNNVDLFLFQIQNLIKIKNLKILSSDEKENQISESLSKIIFMNFENFIFFTKNQTIIMKNLLCFLEVKTTNLILIKNVFFSGEFLMALNFLKLQNSSIILKFAHIDKFKGLFLNILEGRLIFNSVFFNEGEHTLANLEKITCLMVNIKINSKQKIRQPFLKSNQSKVFLSGIVLTGIHIEEGFLLNFYDSDIYIKKMLAISIKGYSENSGLLRISGLNRRIHLKLCNFFMNLGSHIPLFFLDSYQFSNLYMLRCKFSLNSAPKGNILHLSQSKTYNFYLNKNTFYFNHFKKNGLPLISKGGLFFSYFSEGTLRNMQNLFNKNKADFGRFIYIEEAKNWNFIDEDDVKFINTKNIKEKQFLIAFFDSYSQDLRAAKLEGIIYDKKYENCLLTIKITASSYGDILDPYLTFTEAFDLNSYFEYDQKLFRANFLNLEGYFCLKGEFPKTTSLFSSSLNFKILFKKMQISQAIYFSISFLVKCDPPKFLDNSGVCSSCPIQTYPSALMKTFSSKDYAQKCLACEVTNNIGLFCFGDEVYTPQINY